MRLHERFKIDVQGTSQGRHSTDVFLRRFKDVRTTFLQNFKNKQQLTFKYFTRHIWCLGSKITQQWCVLYFV